MKVRMSSCLELGKRVWLKEANGNGTSNFVFSPFSINACLSLLASGTTGKTSKQLLSFLGHDSLADLNSSISSQIKSLRKIGKNEGLNVIKSLRKIGKNEGLNLSFANGLWLDSSFTLRDSYKRIVTSLYEAEAKAVDFRNKANEVRTEINGWVEKETTGLIKDLIPCNGVVPETRLVLANALYFKGAWENEFNRSKTQHSEFHLLDGSSVQVPMMTSRKDQYISTFKDFKVLELPYKPREMFEEPRFSMYLFLPNKRNGLHDLIDKLSSDPSFLEQHLPTQKVQVRNFQVPKFKISFGFEAKNILKELGVVLPFDLKEAEFDEMLTDELASKELYVSEVYHKCITEVDEGGTLAAAATAIWTVGSCCRKPTELTDFVADHPFMFIIRDEESGAVLFMGYVLNPQLQ